MIVVIDTNVLISAAILKQSTADRAVRKAFSNDVVIRSASTTAELSGTLKKKKFDKYFKDEYEKDIFIHLFATSSKIIEVFHPINICRDPKDNQYLELALSGKAECIVTGDRDLLSLNPFKNIAIISPKEFLDRF